jgi:NADPH:quinone reductase-like Zn-dependent oxidoreductase
VDEVVTRVKKGDFVYTHNSKGGGYQRFSASHEKGVGKVDEKHVEAAAAVVLNLRTIIGAAVQAGLDRPKDPATSNSSNGKRALVYGGSSSLGAISIQYLQQAGYTVISTSSPRNNGLVSGFGATIVDHTQPAEAVIAELKQRGPYDFAFDAISTPAATAINAAVLGAQSGDIVLYSVGPPPPADVVIPDNVSRVNKSWPGHLAAADPTYDEWVFTKYIPEGVAAGKLKSVPTDVVKGGLGAVDEALRRLEKGVSGQKLIVYPWEDADKSEL